MAGMKGRRDVGTKGRRDVGTKGRRTPAFRRFDLLTFGRLAAVVLVAAVTSGCVSGNPGGQVRRSLSQSKTYEWTDGGNFRVQGDGPQTERFTMLQGDIAMTVGEDGNPIVDWENSAIAYYLSADPSADAASNTMTQALYASTEQVKAMSGTFDRMLTLLSAGLLRTPMPAAPATTLAPAPVVPVP